MSVEEAIRDYVFNKTRNNKGNCKYFYKGKKLTSYFNRRSSAYNTCVYLIYKGMSVEKAVEKTLENPNIKLLTAV